jgi:hypothetical protein
MSDESSIVVYVEPDPRFAGEASGQVLPEKLAERIDELGDGLGKIANDLRARLDATLESDDGSGWGLEEVQLSFSLGLEAEAGIVVAKAKTAAGFEAALTWRRTGD